MTDLRNDVVLPAGVRGSHASADRALFSRRLAVSRNARGMTQDELAARLGVSAQAISQWEQGKTGPAFENVMDLVEVFGADALFTPSIEEIDLNAPSTMVFSLKSAREELIPEDIWIAADDACSDIVEHGHRPAERVAQAIFAERKRCADEACRAIRRGVA